MLEHPLKILLVEDNPGDVRLIREMLADSQAKGISIEWVPSLSKGLEYLDKGGIDLVLLDLGLPDSQGLDTFFKAYTQAPEIPFVLLTGLADETVALTAVRKGAQDYLVKGEANANTLFKAIRYATERKKGEEALRQARDELEIRVQERTAELQAANQHLQEEIIKRRQTEEALRLAHDNLELKVAMRTAELAKINRELEEEIKERKVVEEALQRQKEEQQIILDSVPAIIFYKDTQNRFIRVNKAIADISGFPAEEIEGKTAFEVFSKNAEAYWKDDLEVIATGNLKRNITELLNTASGVKWLQTDKLPYRDERGNIIGVVGFSLDITERKQAEEALRESEERFRTIFENAAIGIILTNLEGRIISCNPALQRMMQCTADDLIGKTFMEISHPDDLEINLKYFHDMLDGKLDHFQVEKRYRRPDGHWFWSRVTVSAFRGADQTPLYNIAMIEDITQHKQAQEKLRESEQNLRYLASQLLTAQERERARISRELHDELGQALLVLKLQAGHIQKKLLPEQSGIKQECQNMAHQFDQLVGEVRRLARDLSPTMVRDLGLSSALNRLIRDFSRHYGVQTEVAQTNGIDELLSREAQINIYRIFQESLTNIGKYAQASNLEVIIKAEAGQLLFLIADNGRGFKVEEVYGRDPARRGLGLMAMEERARMMGGVLEIKSQEGQGTRLKLTIPDNSSR